jgi:uncharacterized protein DUF3617
MKNALAAIGAVALALSVSLAAQPQGPRRDGRWEVSMEMALPGAPQRMPPVTMTQSITPEEAKDPEKAMPQGASRGTGPNTCKISDYKVAGNKVTWLMKCQGRETMNGSGEFVYSGDTYTGTIKMDRGGGQAMTLNYKGKRLGDCIK